jgi:hypothetical protein
VRACVVFSLPAYQKRTKASRAVFLSFFIGEKRLKTSFFRGENDYVSRINGGENDLGW